MSEPQYRAPAARSKLIAAEGVLAGLAADVAGFALDASEGKSGAEKALVVHRAKVDAAERSVSELRLAVVLAEKLDKKIDEAARAKMRAEQLAAFHKHGKERVAAAEDILKAAAVMSSAMQRYGIATLNMVSVTPAGTSIPAMNIGREGIFGAALGKLELLLAGEFYRLGAGVEPFNGQRFFVPFAKQPTLGSTDHRAMQPGIDAFRDAHNAIVNEIVGQIAKLDARDMNVATGEPEALKGAA